MMPIEWYLQDQRQGVLDDSGAAAVRQMARSLGIPIYEDTAGGRLFVAPPLHGRVIVIDPGHGGADPGHRGTSGRAEAEIALAVARRLVLRLEGVGARPVLTRGDDRELSVQARREIAYGAAPDAIVSIHVGSYADATVRGVGAFYGLLGLRSSRDLASCILRQLSDRTGLPARLPKPVWLKSQAEGYGALVTGSVPAVIVECGCLSFGEEERLLGNADFLDRVADGLYAGLASHFSVEPVTAVWPWVESEEVISVKSSENSRSVPVPVQSVSQSHEGMGASTLPGPQQAGATRAPASQAAVPGNLALAVGTAVPGQKPASLGPVRAVASVQVGVNPNPLLPPGASGPGTVFRRPVTNPGSPPLLARSQAPVTVGPHLVAPPVPIHGSTGTTAMPPTDPRKYAGPLPPGATVRPFG